MDSSVLSKPSRAMPICDLVNAPLKANLLHAHTTGGAFGELFR